MGLSDNSLNLTIHRETRCLLIEIFTEFAGVKKKRNDFRKRLNDNFFGFYVAGGTPIANGIVVDNVTVVNDITKLIR